MIDIDPDVFAYQEEMGYSNETVVVVGAADLDTVVEALNRAGRRFMLVDATGAEHPDEQSAQSALEAGRYTPNYVADPQITGEGVEMYLDCKGVIEQPMVSTLRQILREELEAAGIDGRVRSA
jgi:hypothetical protein